ncbi:hypothetical protein [Riemerella columbina]|uniref:hypothetical protein n=1 Tax=Riemerella columbina TaxID=103810 RepID=UPI0026703222|nr:hypothetical protein [Riemerella columbina]WKS95453.1 hypothetical protein NYR17_01570 [Riemerella columbina]
MFAKYNQWLLKRYPNIWNYKLFPFLPIALLINLLNFILGMLYAQDNKLLQNGGIYFSEFDSSLAMINGIASIVLLVLWISRVVKNNAFKNYYPMKHRQLYGQFLMVFLMFFVSVSFYYSFYLGKKTVVEYRFSDEKMAKMTETINLGGAFLGDDLTLYELDQRRYSKIFEEIECITTPEDIIKTEKYYQFADRYYQFVTLKKVKRTHKPEPIEEEDDEAPDQPKSIHNNIIRRNGSAYVVDKVVDMDAYVKTAKPSYRNYSTELISPKNNKSGWLYYRYREPSAAMNQKINALLDRNDPKEIQKVLQDFLDLSKELKIDHKLSAEAWLKMVYHPDNFEVKTIIGEKLDVSNVTPTAISKTDDDELVALIEDGGDRYSNQLLSKNSWYELSQLRDLMNVVSDIKSEGIWTILGIVLLWIAFGFSTLFFTYRVLNFRAILLGIVTSGVLSIVNGLFALVSFSGTSIVFTAFITWSILALFPVLSRIDGSKKLNSVAIAITLNAFPLMILNGMQLHDLIKDALYPKPDTRPYDRDLFLFIKSLSPEHISLLILVLSFVLMRLYIPILFKWQQAKE